MNYYKHHLGDYDAATAHLTLLEDGAYSRLLRLYYRTEKPIPANIVQACRLVRAASKAERDAVESVLREFFVLEADGWHQKRCDEEISAYTVKAERNRESGKKGGRPPKTETETVSETEPTNNPNGFEMETQMVSKNNPSHKPLAISQEKTLTPPTPLADAKGVNGHAKRRRKPRTECPDAIEITDAMYDWANKLGLNDERIEHETETMLSYHAGKGSEWANWQKAWQTWMLNAVKFSKERRQ